MRLRRGPRCRPGGGSRISPVLNMRSVSRAGEGAQASAAHEPEIRMRAGHHARAADRTYALAVFMMPTSWSANCGHLLDPWRVSLPLPHLSPTLLRRTHCSIWRLRFGSAITFPGGEVCVDASLLLRCEPVRRAASYASALALVGDAKHHAACLAVHRVRIMAQQSAGWALEAHLRRAE